MLRWVLIVALVAALGFLGSLNVHRLGGRYMLRDSDHAEVMLSGTTALTRRTVRILFIGNSFTYVNDLPAMLVNLAASDPGNPTQLSVKGFTYENADLGFMLRETGALAWARANPVDYVVLQDHSGWYALPEWTERAQRDTAAWVDALRPLKATPVLFAPWADGEGSNVYTDPEFYAYGKTPAEDTLESEQTTGLLAQSLNVPMVRVARAFNQAEKTGRVPDLYQSDRHHPSAAGTYLAALSFYRFFTRRSGVDATYRPWGLSAAGKAALVEAAGK